MNTDTILEEKSYPINVERDNAVVELSKSIANIISAKQGKTLNIGHFESFKNSFVRLTNLTLYNENLSKAKYKDKPISEIIEKIRNEDTKKENVNMHVEIAFVYMQQLFKMGVIKT